MLCVLRENRLLTDIFLDRISLAMQKPIWLCVFLALSTGGAGDAPGEDGGGSEAWEIAFIIVVVVLFLCFVFAFFWWRNRRNSSPYGESTEMAAAPGDYDYEGSRSSGYNSAKGSDSASLGR